MAAMLGTVVGPAHPLCPFPLGEDPWHLGGVDLVPSSRDERGWYQPQQ